MNPTNPNEAEDAERRMLENELLGVVSQLPFLERGKTLSSSMYPELTDFILADRQAQKQKWVEQMDASFPTKHQLWVTATSIVNADSEDHEDDEIIEPVFKLLEVMFAAWRAALRGKTNDLYR